MKPISQRLADARTTMLEKTKGLDVDALPISDYNKQYLGRSLKNHKRVFNRQSRLLELALEGKGDLKDCVFIDYGGGTGLCGALAHHAGVGTVVYNDIYDVSCQDAAHIAKALGHPLEHIVCGTVDDLAAYLKAQGIQPDAIASYDVIEHIYDVARHFGILKTLSDKGLRVVYSSSANPANKKVRKHMAGKQHTAEHEGRSKNSGHKEMDTVESFMQIRQRLIAEYAPELDEKLVAELAEKTRGLRKDDIHACIERHRTTGDIGYTMSHPTNTCDPHTGNWCENLLDADWLVDMATSAGFSAAVLPGLHSTSSEGGVKKLAKHLANQLIRGTGGNGLKLAPYYILVAD